MTTDLELRAQVTKLSGTKNAVAFRIRIVSLLAGLPILRHAPLFAC